MKTQIYYENHERSCDKVKFYRELLFEDECIDEMKRLSFDWW